MDESYVNIKDLSVFRIRYIQALILLLEDKFSGQIYFDIGTNLWRGFATYRLLLGIVENSPLKQQ